MSNHKGEIPKLVTSKDEIIVTYSDVLDGIGYFTAPLYHIQVSHASKPLADQSLLIWKSLSDRILTKCYKQEFWSQLTR